MQGIDAELHRLARRQLRVRVEALTVSVCAGSLLSIAPALEAAGPEFRSVFLTALVGLSILTIAFVVRLAALAAAECPRCAQGFHRLPAAPLFQGRQCAHCDLALPRVASSRPTPPTPAA